MAKKSSEAESFEHMKINILHTWRWPCRPKHVVYIYYILASRCTVLFNGYCRLCFHLCAALSWPGRPKHVVKDSGNQHTIKLHADRDITCNTHWSKHVFCMSKCVYFSWPPYGVATWKMLNSTQTLLCHRSLILRLHLCLSQINRNRIRKQSWYSPLPLYNMARLWCTRKPNSVPQFSDGRPGERRPWPECWSICSSLFSRHRTFRDFLLSWFMSCFGVYRPK
jgi:hypothetical protein